MESNQLVRASTWKLNVSLTPALLVSWAEKCGCAYMLVMDVKRVFMEALLFSGVLFNEGHRHMDNHVSQTLYMESLWQTWLIIKGFVNSDWTLSIWGRGTIYSFLFLTNQNKVRNLTWLNPIMKNLMGHIDSFPTANIKEVNLVYNHWTENSLWLTVYCGLHQRSF